MSITAKVDTSSFEAGLAKLAGPLRISLARSMAVAGGKVIRDEARLRAPKDDGTLSNAMYLAFKEAKSSEKQAVYSVTWHKKKAPHGHLIEFGHWQPYVVVKGSNGQWFTTKKLRPDGPKWISAKPFLRPAADAAGGRAREAMIARGRERLPELLAGINTESAE